MPALYSTPNPKPNTIFNKLVQFSTVDEISNTTITESYNVSNPYNTQITYTVISSGSKVVVPLTTQTGNGAPFLKFHLPNNSTTANTMHVTFCVKNTQMADGYYDYKTGIPVVYKNALKSWIVQPTTSLNISGPREKELRFTVYGTTTNKPQEATTFKVTFKANYTPGTTPSGVVLTAQGTQANTTI